MEGGVKDFQVELLRSFLVGLERGQPKILHCHQPCVTSSSHTGVLWEPDFEGQSLRSVATKWGSRGSHIAWEIVLKFKFSEGPIRNLWLRRSSNMHLNKPSRCSDLIQSLKPFVKPLLTQIWLSDQHQQQHQTFISISALTPNFLNQNLHFHDISDDLHAYWSMGTTGMVLNFLLKILTQMFERIQLKKY